MGWPSHHTLLLAGESHGRATQRAPRDRQDEGGSPKLCVVEGIDRDLEELAKSCSKCAIMKQAPVKDIPGRPWERVHINFAGPFLNKNFLIAVDAHFKWAEVVEMPQTMTAKTITTLRHMFATHGIPKQLVSDNGSQFTSSEFTEFIKVSGIKHTLLSISNSQGGTPVVECGVFR